MKISNMKLLSYLRRSLVSLCLSAGVLSIATIDSVWQESHHIEDLAKARIEKSKEILRNRLPEVINSKNNQQISLRENLASDEIGEINPFSSLTNLDQIENLFKRGIKSFKRETFRSASYSSENGYDLIHYEINLVDSGTAHIMAYLENVSLTSRDKVPFVAIITESFGSTSYVLFKEGKVVDSMELTRSEAMGVVARRIDASIPFLSVSR